MHALREGSKKEVSDLTSGRNAFAVATEEAKNRLDRYEQFEADALRRHEHELHERSNQAAQYYERAEQRERELTAEMGVAGLRSVELERTRLAAREDAQRYANLLVEAQQRNREESHYRDGVVRTEAEAAMMRIQMW